MPKSHSIARRSFLQGVAGLGGAAILSSSMQRAAGYQSANDRPVFATIGLRNQGWTITSKSFKFADFAALADVDSNVLAENVEKTEMAQKRKPDAYKDYRKVLDRKDIDAVMIATPDHWHTKIAVEAMLAGKDVYCEKPLTLTIAEGKLIEKVVKETGRVFQVGTMQRTESDLRFLQAIALVRDGRIGKVQRVTCGINGMEASPVILLPQCLKTRLGSLVGACTEGSTIAPLPQLREGYGGGVPLFSNCHYSFRNWHEYGRQVDRLGCTSRGHRLLGTWCKRHWTEQGYAAGVSSCQWNTRMAIRSFRISTMRPVLQDQGRHAIECRDDHHQRR